MKTLVYEYNGYNVGDRLLEDVIFQVIVEVTNDSIRIQSLAPRSDMNSYLNNIKWENFVFAMRNDIESKIEALLSSLKAQNKTVFEELDQYKHESGLPGIQVLDEV